MHFLVQLDEIILYHKETKITSITKVNLLVSTEKNIEKEAQIESVYSIDFLEGVWVSRAPGSAFHFNIEPNGRTINAELFPELEETLLSLQCWQTLGFKISPQNALEDELLQDEVIPRKLMFNFQHDRESSVYEPTKRAKKYGADISYADVIPPKGIPILYLHAIEVDIRLEYEVSQESSVTDTPVATPTQEDDWIFDTTTEIVEESDDLLDLMPVNEGQVEVENSCMAYQTHDSSIDRCGMNSDPFDFDSMLFENGSNPRSDALLDSSVTEDPLDLTDEEPEMIDITYLDHTIVDYHLFISTAMNLLFFGLFPRPKGFKVEFCVCKEGLCILIPSIFNIPYLSNIALRHNITQSIARTLSGPILSRFRSETLKQKASQIIDHYAPPQDQTPTNIMKERQSMQVALWHHMVNQMVPQRVRLKRQISTITAVSQVLTSQSESWKESDSQLQMLDDSPGYLFNGEVFDDTTEQIQDSLVFREEELFNDQGLEQDMLDFENIASSHPVSPNNSLDLGLFITEEDYVEKVEQQNQDSMDFDNEEWINEQVRDSIELNNEDWLEEFQFQEQVDETMDFKDLPDLPTTGCNDESEDPKIDLMRAIFPSSDFDFDFNMLI